MYKKYMMFSLILFIKCKKEDKCLFPFLRTLKRDICYSLI
jgi:hypothetical protein